MADESAPATGADDAYVQALLNERAGYLRYGHMDRVAHVDAELERLGVTPPPEAPKRPRRGKG